MDFLQLLHSLVNSRFLPKVIILAHLLERLTFEISGIFILWEFSRETPFNATIHRYRQQRGNDQLRQKDDMNARI